MLENVCLCTGVWTYINILLNMFVGYDKCLSVCMYVCIYVLLYVRSKYVNMCLLLCVWVGISGKKGEIKDKYILSKMINMNCVTITKIGNKKT